MSYLPSKKVFVRVKERQPRAGAAGLLMLEQKDGAVFALEQSEDLLKAYQSALPRREGYWSYARWLPVPDRTERAALLVALTALWAPKRLDSTIDTAVAAIERLKWHDG